MVDASSPPPPDAPSDNAINRAVRSVSLLARRLTTGVAVLAVASAGAGGFLWILLWWPLSVRLLPLLGTSISFVVLLAPATVLGLFYQGLRDLLALPDRISERTSRTLSQTTASAQTVATRTTSGALGRLWGLLTEMWALRRTLLENKALLVRYGALIRFVNPGFLLLVVLSAGTTLLLIPIACGAGLFTLVL